MHAFSFIPFPKYFIKIGITKWATDKKKSETNTKNKVSWFVREHVKVIFFPFLYRYTHIYGYSCCEFGSLLQHFGAYISSEANDWKPPNVLMWTWWFSSPKTSFNLFISLSHFRARFFFFSCMLLFCPLSLLLLVTASATVERTYDAHSTVSRIIEWADISIFLECRDYRLLV